MNPLPETRIIRGNCMRPLRRHVAALQRIAAIPLYGEPIHDPSLVADLITAMEYDVDNDAFEPSCDTESSQLRDAVETARVALRLDVTP